MVTEALLHGSSVPQTGTLMSLLRTMLLPNIAGNFFSNPNDRKTHDKTPENCLLNHTPVSPYFFPTHEGGGTINKPLRWIWEANICVNPPH